MCTLARAQGKLFPTWGWSVKGEWKKSKRKRKGPARSRKCTEELGQSNWPGFWPTRKKNKRRREVTWYGAIVFMNALHCENNSRRLEGIAQVLVCKPWASCVLDLGAYLQHPHPLSRKSLIVGDPNVDLSFYGNRFIASIWESGALRSSGASHRPTCLVKVSIALRKHHDQK